MKKSVLLTSLSLIFVSSFAQPNDLHKNAIMFGLNGGFFGSGDFYMPSPYLEYSRSINPWLSITPRIMYGRSSRQNRNIFDLNSFIATSVAISLKPILRVIPDLQVHIGGLYQQLESSHGWIPYPSTGEVVNYRYDNDKSYGVFGSLSYQFFEKTRFAGGSRLDMLTSFRKSYFSFESIQVGVYLAMGF